VADGGGLMGAARAFQHSKLRADLNQGIIVLASLRVAAYTAFSYVND
jgi:hypothetical protein